MREEAIRVLQKDPRLKHLLSQVEIPELHPQPDQLYENLLASVLSQQLSAKAASTIHGRFLDLFPNRYPAPSELRTLTDEQLRAAGVSRQKAGYLRNIAERFDEEDLVHADWASWTDEEVVEHLTRIKGVGTWTARMILMFTLGRPDVFPVEDQGIQSAMDRYYQLPEKGKARKNVMQEIAETWRPFRTFACMFLWQALDNKL
jgi:DNA-3-methyladenine glycosylase II